ncbi:MAG: M20/M25/M40 family metallo-hydrolase [Deltaproteobacteria bacterium]|nr:M20/M25/M40 family metallo-hydrolase [Deltaproteobacteria bacterium]
MRTDKATIEKVLSYIDREELARLAMDVVSIPSPTGSEGEVAKFIVDWLKKQGIEVLLQEIEKDRYNVVGILRGQGGGPTLLYNGHMDTALAGTQEDLLITGSTRPEWQALATRDGDIIRGSGIVNDKGPLTCTLIMAKALKQSGVPFKGDIILTGVAGEIGRAPVDQFQGPAYRGKGAGARFLVSHGVVADYAIVVEPSQLRITWAQCGAVFIKLTTRGEPMYAPFVEHPASPRESKNAVVRMASIVPALEEWARQYEKKHRYEFKGGTMIPKVNIGSISGGAPFKPNFSPAICNLYVEAFMAPGQRAIEVLREVNEVLRATGIETTCSLFLSVNGYEAEGAEPLVEAMEEAHLYVRGRKPEPIRSAFTSTYADLTVFIEVGIPAIKCGPAPDDPNAKPATGEMQQIDDLLAAAKMYAISSLEIVNRPL